MRKLTLADILRQFLTLLAATALLTGAALGLVGCSDQDRYVPVAGTVYDVVDGDYEQACYDKVLNEYVDPDICYDGHVHGNVYPVWYAMPVGTWPGHGYNAHRPGDTYIQSTTVINHPPAARARVFTGSGGKVTLYNQGKRVGPATTYSATKRKAAEKARVDAVQRDVRAADSKDRKNRTIKFATGRKSTTKTTFKSASTTRK